MQVTGNHFLARAGLTQNQHRSLGIGHLLHHLAHSLNRSAGTHKAAEQVGLTLALAAAVFLKHLAIDLSAVQGIQQMVVAQRWLEHSQQALFEVVWPQQRLLRIKQNHRQVFIPFVQLAEQRGQALGMSAMTENDTADVAWRIDRRIDSLLPAFAVGNNGVFAQKGQNNAQIMTPLGGVINQ